MCLYWGVIPVAGAPTGDSDALLEYIVDRGRRSGRLQSGDRIVALTGSGLRRTAHNIVVVHELD
jgi:hypothetical protein